MLPVVAIGIGLLGGGAWYAQSKRQKNAQPMTAEKRFIYESAINSTLTPEQYRALAKGFRTEGFKVEADMLEKRAALREAPKELAAERRDIYRRAMNSVNVPGILKVADAFDSIGATGAAASLRERVAAIHRGEVPVNEQQ